MRSETVTLCIVTLPGSKLPTPLSRATASLVGLAIADAAGHPFEFMPVVDKVGETGQYFDIEKLTWTRPMNRFKLKVRLLVSLFLPG